jgi:hypothetical protein
MAHNGQPHTWSFHNPQIFRPSCFGFFKAGQFWHFSSYLSKSNKVIAVAQGKGAVFDSSAVFTCWLAG